MHDPRRVFLWGMRSIQILALAVAAAVTALGIAQAVLAFTSPRIALRFPISAAVPPDRLVSGGGVSLDSATFSQASVTVSGVGILDRTLLAVSALLAACCVVAIAATVLLLCRRLLHGTPFASATISAALLTGSALVFAGGGSRLLLAVVRWSVTEHWDGDPLFTSAFGVDWTVATLTLDWMPVLLGLFCYLLAGVFHVGQRLQDDVEGLV